MENNRSYQKYSWKKSIIVAAMLLVLIIAGCTPANYPLNCNTGTQGFSASFDSGSMRNNYDSGIIMPLRVTLYNSGASDAQAIVRVGYNQDLLLMSSSDLSSCKSSSACEKEGCSNVCGPPKLKVNLSGKSNFDSCQGSATTGTFYIKPYTLPLASQSFKTNLQLDVCYHYWNNLTNQKVCVDPNTGSLNALQPNCKASDINLGGGQGSPVGIVKIEAPVYKQNSKKVFIRVYIRNFGNGNIVASETANSLEDACSLQPDVHNNYVNVKGFLDNYELDCNMNNPGAITDKTYLQYDPQTITQNNQQETLKDYYFNCETKEPVNIDSAVNMNLNLMIAYYYRNFNQDSQTINIRKVQ